MNRQAIANFNYNNNFTNLKYIFKTYKTWLMKFIFHEMLFHPQMTPKTHFKKSGKNDFEKSSRLPASLDGSSQPKKIILFNFFLPIDSSHGDLSTLF